MGTTKDQRDFARHQLALHHGWDWTDGNRHWAEELIDDLDDALAQLAAEKARAEVLKGGLTMIAETFPAHGEIEVYANGCRRIAKATLSAAALSAPTGEERK